MVEGRLKSRGEGKGSENGTTTSRTPGRRKSHGRNRTAMSARAVGNKSFTTHFIKLKIKRLRKIREVGQNPARRFQKRVRTVAMLENVRYLVYILHSNTIGHSCKVADLASTCFLHNAFEAIVIRNQSYNANSFGFLCVKFFIFFLQKKKENT